MFRSITFFLGFPFPKVFPFSLSFHFFFVGFPLVPLFFFQFFCSSNTKWIFLTIALYRAKQRSLRILSDIGIQFRHRERDTDVQTIRVMVVRLMQSIGMTEVVRCTTTRLPARCALISSTEAVGLYYPVCPRRPSAVG